MTNRLDDCEGSLRTLRYRAELQQRRHVLDAHLRSILSPSSTFTWEIGCGHGHFLTAYAAAHPHEICIGIDVVSERIHRALRKRDRAKLDNLIFLQAEARLFLEALPPSATFTELFILFPDPWPKRRHRKHRILQADFLSSTAARAAENSRLCFRTDCLAYFHQAQQVLGNHSSWRIAPESWPFEFCTVFQSRAVEHHSLIGRRTGAGGAS